MYIVAFGNGIFGIILNLKVSSHINHVFINRINYKTCC